MASAQGDTSTLSHAEINQKPTEDNPLKVIGYGIPLNATSTGQFSKHVDNAVEGWTGYCLTLREREMLKFLSSITDKPEWHRKIYDETITSKWSAELGVGDDDDDLFTNEMFAYSLDELKDYASQLEEKGYFPTIDNRATVYKSDTMIDEALKTSFRTAAAALEEVPENQRDWHPGSDEQVLDLVHPSLYPLLYGQSRILPNRLAYLEDCLQLTGRGEVMPIPPESDVASNGPVDQWDHLPAVLYSKRFQWLPCEVAFRGNNDVAITSYINNLHPVRHKPLYNVIEKIISKCLPMLEASVTSTSEKWRPSRLNCEGPSWTYDEDKRPRREDHPELNNPDDDEDDSAWDDFIWEWEDDNKQIHLPPPETSGPYEHRKSNRHPEWLDFRRDFAKSGLQFIVKMANIHLTPESPKYHGGSWHVEGSLNEHICATALYYYDCDNITDSYLSFRESIDPLAMEYEQSEDQHFNEHYGITSDSECIQDLGAVLTREDRLLTFPNVLQHYVDAFKLKDPSKPGHRKILALFLIDPFVRIPSTANVPPQQKDWWAEQAIHQEGQLPVELPAELIEQIVDEVDEFPIGLEEAKRLRLELMQERQVFHQNVDDHWQRNTYNFCEH